MASDHRFPFQRLDVYQVEFTLSRRVNDARVRAAELRDQVTRAVKSTFLKLCEGLPEDRPKVRAKDFRDADNSLHETVGAIDLAQALGAVDAQVATEMQALAFRVRNMIRALRAPRPSIFDSRSSRSWSWAPSNRRNARRRSNAASTSAGPGFSTSPSNRRNRTLHDAALTPSTHPLTNYHTDVMYLSIHGSAC